METIQLQLEKIIKFIVSLNNLTLVELVWKFYMFL